MDTAPAPPALAVAQPYRVLFVALFRLRWATLALVLGIAVLLPVPGRAGWPAWGLLLLFAGYTALADWLLRRWPGSLAHRARALLDLPVAALLYWLGADPGGPLFVLLALAVICAAVVLR